MKLLFFLVAFSLAGKCCTTNDSSYSPLQTKEIDDSDKQPEIILNTSDGKQVSVPREVASKFKLVESFLTQTADFSSAETQKSDQKSDQQLVFPIPNVHSQTLEFLVKYAKLDSFLDELRYLFTNIALILYTFFILITSFVFMIF